MQLTKEHIGVKVTRPDWGSSYFIPERLDRDFVYGVVRTKLSDYSDSWYLSGTDWELYEESKQEKAKGAFCLTKEHAGVRVCLPFWNERGGDILYFVPGSGQDFFTGAYIDGTNYFKNGTTGLDYWYNDEQWHLYQGPEAPLEKEPVGLSLEEAMDSGKDFRLVGDRSWCYVSNHGAVVIRHESGDLEAPLTRFMINGRYELKPDPKKVEVTAAQLEKVWKECVMQGGLGVNDWLSYIKRELGLED